MADLQWYSARTLYRHPAAGKRRPIPLFEERVVLFRASDWDDALAQAEAEAKLYCEHLEDTVSLRYVMLFHLFDESIVSGTEVFSLMRESLLPDKDYIDRFYEDGQERAQSFTDEAQE